MFAVAFGVSSFFLYEMKTFPSASAQMFLQFLVKERESQPQSLDNKSCSGHFVAIQETLRLNTLQAEFFVGKKPVLKCSFILKLKIERAKSR